MSVNVPDIRVSQVSLPEAGVPTGTQPNASAAPVSEVRRFLMERGNSAVADRLFQWLIVLSAFSIFGIVLLIGGELVKRSELAWHAFGMKFFTWTQFGLANVFRAFMDPMAQQPTYWDPVNGNFNALPFHPPGL